MEPTQAELDSLELELDELLSESQVIAEKRKELKRLSARHSTDLTPLEYIPLDSWKPQFTCAMFIQQTCQQCGAVHHSFSHFAEWQTFTGKIAGNPNRWCKVDPTPEVMAAISSNLPRLIPQTIPICSSCFPAHLAIPFSSER